MNTKHSQPILPADVELSSIAKKAADQQSHWVSVWHVKPEPEPATTLFLQLVQDQHKQNFDLWHEEDKARAVDVSDSEIAKVKRAIDKLNQRRNDLIETLDEVIQTWLLEQVPTFNKKAPWNSETPGSIIDRLSIMSLKIYHMREQEDRVDANEEHRQKCNQKRETLEIQRQDLTQALEVLLEDLKEGRKQLKLYRQFKMYNDPTLNPALYNAGKK